MSTLATRIETQAGRPLPAEEIFAITRAREVSLSRLLMFYVTTGLVFMLLPGTFLGVWNLPTISSRHAANSVPAGWIQAHGHAQIFGWIGTFILGIGYYSIPRLRRMNPFALRTAWVCWTLWVAGVSLRWLATAYRGIGGLCCPSRQHSSSSPFCCSSMQFPGIGLRPRAIRSRTTGSSQ